MARTSGSRSASTFPPKAAYGERAERRPGRRPALPTREDLNRATARTQAALEDPASTVTDVHRAAELEAATLHAYWQTPGAQAKAELEREPRA